MLTIQPSSLSLVVLTTLSPGDIFFQHSGQHGSHIGMLVRNDSQYASWLRLTGKHQFRMEDTAGGGAYTHAHAPRVLRLGIHRNDLRFQIDQTSVTRPTMDTLRVGWLLIREQPRIVTIIGDGDVDQDELSGLSLVDLSRESVEAPDAYVCTKWRLIHVPPGLPPEVIAEFSPTSAATAEPLRI